MDCKQKISAFIKAEAKRLGFCACGLAKAQPVSIEAQRMLRESLDKDYCADMDYLRNYFEIRTNPQLLVDGAQTVVSVALNYYPEKKLDDSQLQFAYYAYGKDYHDVMKEKLRHLLESVAKYLDEQSDDIRAELLGDASEFSGRAFCDTAPILEKYWAQQSGIGWIGKHTQVVIPFVGSYVFLGELVINLKCSPDEPLKERCGKCQKCLNACPTKALKENRMLDARKCLSYLTIENRENIPEEASEAMQSCVYGCDRCIKACPWNRFASPTREEGLMPNEAFMNMTPADWENLDVETYRKIFKGSAVKRAKFEGLQRNIKCVLDNLKRKKQ